MKGVFFTIIERERPDNASESSPVKSPESVNCSFHTDSLTAGERGDARTGCAVTKSCERKPPIHGGLWPVPKALLGNVEQQITGLLKMEEEGTGNQSGRQGKHTGRRQTNVRRHRKSDPARITGRVGYIRLRRPSVRCGKSDIIGEENGQTHPMTRRCKRRRHVWKDSLSTWGEPAWSRQRVNESIRRNAEIWTDAMQGVGDGHISLDGKDNTTLPTQRVISLRTCPKIREGQRMNAEKAQEHPVKRVRVNRRAIYSSANANGTKYDGGGMRKKESQGESRTWENRISGSVCGVKAIPFVRSAFTLVELLVVVVIITILASILLPAIKKARGSGYQIACASNLKQVGKASVLYIDDYNMWVPAGYQTAAYGFAGNTIEFLFPYLKIASGMGSIYRPYGKVTSIWCPGETTTPSASLFFNYPANSMATSGSDWNAPLRYTEVIHPSITSWFMDGQPNTGSIIGSICDNLGTLYDVSYVPYKRHGKGFNVLYMDCHVEKFNTNTVPAYDICKGLYYTNIAFFNPKGGN